jgi:hypothetical protein
VADHHVLALLGWDFWGRTLWVDRVKTPTREYRCRAWSVGPATAPLRAKALAVVLRSDVQRLRGARILPCQTHRFGQDRRTDRAGQSLGWGGTRRAQRRQTDLLAPRVASWGRLEGAKEKGEAVEETRKRQTIRCRHFSSFFPPSKGPYARFSIPLHPGRINHQAFSLSRLCAHKHSSAQQYMIIISHLLRLL